MKSRRSLEVQFVLNLGHLPTNVQSEVTVSLHLLVGVG